MAERSRHRLAYSCLASSPSSDGSYALVWGSPAGKCPYALQRWHLSVLEAAIAAPRPETTGPDTFSRLLVVETVGRLLEVVDRREFSPVMHLLDELELWGLGQTGDHDVQVDIVGDFLPQPFESKPEVPSFRKDVNEVTAQKVPAVETLVVTRTPSFLSLSVQTRVESFPSRPPIPPGVGLRPFFSTCLLYTSPSPRDRG